MSKVFNPILDIPLWPDTPPLSQEGDSEIHARVLPDESAIYRWTDVTEPTLSFYPATGIGSRPCVLVMPGGAYEILAWNHEGTDVVHWLLSHNISAALLKYRCPKRREQALADSRRAMRMLRANAEKWDIDASKIGVLGFSAGGNLALRTACSKEPDYPKVDELEDISYRPDFSVLVYPAYVDRPGWTTDPNLEIDSSLGPVFITHSFDDPYGDSPLALTLALRKAKVPFELHVWPEGGHGWGMFRSDAPHANWPELAAAWLRRVAKP